MSHLAARIVADHLKSNTEGVNAIAALVPRDGADPLPPAVTVYDETRDGWVAHDVVPHKDAAGTVISFPFVAVSTNEAIFDGGIPLATAEGAQAIEGPSVTVGIKLVMRNTDSEKDAVAAMYLMRAIRNSLLVLDAPDHLDNRTRCGVRLEQSSRVTQGRVLSPAEDVVSDPVLLVTYPVTETTVLGA